MNLTPTQRAAVRIAMAHRLADGLPVTREQLVRKLFGPPVIAVATVRPVEVATLAPSLAVVFVEPPPVTPDVTPDGVDVHPDQVITFTEAARMTGLSVGTVRRYCAPSSGKLRRSGTGVSLASIEAMAA
ncbi:helix-turn-helix domain-containing protein [Frankia sp. AiPs1]|uniref:helix-turn-helix domain-containing protein n=1 Tax=Frankia sp. AiPs1 TaxID=573493 RepID=UPI0020439079|nr:helix-turn-helix domain-containing protein [Frankia sp. AiPs1]MCM3920726.1 helix-turn-helix domain-containing protein [Frankia sp. AiPs1]